MAETPKTLEAAPAQPSPAWRVWLGRSAALLIAVGILAVGALVSVHWLSNRPRAERRPRGKAATLVDVMPIETGNHRVTIEAMGTVRPARHVTLAPQVSGRVVAVSDALVPGGLLGAGEEVLRIEPDDFQVTLEQVEAEVRRLESTLAKARTQVALRKADVAKAEAALQIEMGQQAIAEREAELLGETVTEDDLDLVLRGPERRSAEATLAAARAALEAAGADVGAAEAALASAQAQRRRAGLDLARTTLRAPFDSQVRSETVDVGSQVSPAAPVAELVGTNVYWIEVTVPVDELRWLRIPRRDDQAGSPVRIFHQGAWPEGTHRTGRVLRLAADLEPRGRMARVLVAVDDPLDLEAPPEDGKPLLIDSYVRVEMEGRDVEAVARVPRSALRDGNRVWVMTPEGTLAIRPVRLAWGSDTHVCVSEGLSAGDRLLVSDLGAPVEGMALRTRERGPASAGDATTQLPEPDSQAEEGAP